MKKQKIQVAQPYLISLEFLQPKITYFDYQENKKINSIAEYLTSYPFINFSINEEAQLVIPGTRQEPSNENINELIEVNQIGFTLVISSCTPPFYELGWEVLREENGTSVIINNEPVYGLKIPVDNHWVQFIPPNSKIWGVHKLLTEI